MTTDHYAYAREYEEREDARPPIDRARDAVNESCRESNNDIIRGRAATLTAFATAEALDRIATALEKAAAEFDDWRGK